MRTIPRFVPGMSLLAKGCLGCAHLPLCGVHSNGSGLAEVTVEKCPSPASICSGHWDGLVSRVCPVDVLMDPVNGQSLGGVELAVNEDHLLGRVTRFVDVGAAGTGGHRAPTQLQNWAPGAAWLHRNPYSAPTTFCFLLQPLISPFPHSSISTVGNCAFCHSTCFVM